MTQSRYRVVTEPRALGVEWWLEFWLTEGWGRMDACHTHLPMHGWSFTTSGAISAARKRLVANEKLSEIALRRRSHRRTHEVSAEKVPGL